MMLKKNKWKKKKLLQNDVKKRMTPQNDVKKNSNDVKKKKITPKWC